MEQDLYLGGNCHKVPDRFTEQTKTTNQMTSITKGYVAILAGATGLVGEQLLMQLLDHPEYRKVLVVSRKPLDVTHAKLEQRIIDFGLLPGAMSGLQADHGFCCLGTTIKKAGSKEVQYRIDHDYVVGFARGCAASGVKRFAAVSSVGANPGSSNFYLRTKGEMEQDIREVPFERTVIVQPSLLMGERKESRTAEKIAVYVMGILNPLMMGSLKKYRGVPVEVVARGLISHTLSGPDGLRTISSEYLT
jgi:uncharacterized protein YbjT (DUF2867 family)